MRSISQRIDPLSLLFTLLLALPHGGLVACLDGGGRVTLQLAGRSDASCDLPSPAEDESRCDACACGKDCGPCDDSRLGALDLGVRQTDAHEDPAPSQAAADHDAPTSVIARSLRPPPRFHPWAPGATSWPDLQRTIVLVV